MAWISEKDPRKFSIDAVESSSSALCELHVGSNEFYTGGATAADGVAFDAVRTRLK